MLPDAPRALRDRHRAFFALLRPLEAVYLGESDGRARVGVEDPCDARRADAIAFVLGVPVDLVGVSAADVVAFFDPPRLPAPGSGLRACRFCGGTFDAARFLDDLGACPGCAEAFLGVVWR